jgi:hypothetical protein
MGSMHRKNILIYIQQDATLHSLFYLETSLHVLGGTIAHHQERKQLYLQHLVFVTPLLLHTAIAAGSSNGVTNTRYSRIDTAPDNGWWYHPQHVEKFSDKINCVPLHLVRYILEYPCIVFVIIYIYQHMHVSCAKRVIFNCTQFMCICWCI